MYKLMIPAIALFGALACGTATPSAAELRVEAAKAETEAALATEEAERATAEEAERAREASKIQVAEWIEFQHEAWDATWDTFSESTDTRFEGAGYALERQPKGSTGISTITVRRVTPTPPPADPMQDAAIQSAVKTRLATDKDVRGRNIDVRVTDNIVYLSGTVGDRAEAREAVRLALNTRGVYDVVSHLTVKK